MLRTGANYLRSLKEGRKIYLGGHLVDDVTTHPAFRNSAQSFAGLFDLKCDPEHAGRLSFLEDGQRHSFYFKQPRSREDLEFRMAGHKAWADASYGLFGRSPDHVGSFITGMTCRPEIFDVPNHGFRQNLLDYYTYIRDNDLYVSYATHPPQGARNYSSDAAPSFFKSPALHVSATDSEGITLHGMKTLATGGAFCDEIWIGNLTPLAPDRIKEAVTCAVPANAEGLSLWSRRSMEQAAPNAFDYPLSSRFDESDCMLVCDNVKVPWSRVFTIGNVDLSRAIYMETGGHYFGNHQSNVRFWAKLQLIVGLANKIAKSAGVRGIPAVQETLGRLAAMEATIAGLIAGQIADHESVGDGYVVVNKRYMYAALSWCQDNYGLICATVRELMGGAIFQMPADISIVENGQMNALFETYWSTEHESALDRMKLYKLAWDLLASEFGARHVQYENFYAGPPFLVRAHSMRLAPWSSLDQTVDKLMASYSLPSDATSTRPVPGTRDAVTPAK
ncbi:4-hydroxyphenylacetate 3-monooxygenase [Bradyrhizobium barranii subsp. apii]|uniref:4-hydroxyphenylacetate 3-hydroxylase family protein n=1 Tax=Bradyrhizobium barranii TaxID=2992140 RepID=UPI001AA0DCBA|nr:4-hydroxyphenylacetate 3-hydroxylase N-terminal domain-containing protein [Bradyrhizobium barranii]UPT93209.1 4-hydroxyphenylacetate 3-monooxygenase [Bradyrhizobium barranii subsp. apii]